MAQVGNSITDVTAAGVPVEIDALWLGGLGVDDAASRTTINSPVALGRAGNYLWRPSVAASVLDPGNVIAKRGWILTAAGLGTPLVPLKQILAGDWTFTLAWTNAATNTYAASVAAIFRCYQVSADLATSTLIALPGADATTKFNKSAIVTPGATVHNGILTIAITGASAVTFAASTPYLFIEVGLAFSGTFTVGATWRAGTSGAEDGWDLAIPGILSAQSLAAATTSTATLARRLSLKRTLRSVSTSTATARRKISKPRASTTTTTASMTRRIRMTRRSVTTTTASIRKLLRKVPMRSVTTSTASLLRRLVLKRTLTSTTTSTANLSKRLIFARTLRSVTTSTARAWAKLPFDKIPGAGTVVNVVRKITAIFDD